MARRTAALTLLENLSYCTPETPYPSDMHMLSLHAMQQTGGYEVGYCVCRPVYEGLLRSEDLSPLRPYQILSLFSLDHLPSSRSRGGRSFRASRLSWPLAVSSAAADARRREDLAAVCFPALLSRSGLRLASSEEARLEESTPPANARDQLREPRLLPLDERTTPDLPL